MQMRDHGRAAIELYEPQPPGQALAKEKVVAVVKHRVGEELSGLGLRLPVQANGQALLARLARRVLHHPAISALLELEAAERRGGGEAERDAAAGRRRGRRQPRAQDRVFSFWAL